MMGWSPQCYIPSFVEIGLPGPEKKILKGLTIYGHGGHLGHVTSILSSDFHFPVPESYHKNLVQIGKVVSEKIRCNRPEFPPVSFFPRGKTGQAHSSPPPPPPVSFSPHMIFFYFRQYKLFMLSKTLFTTSKPNIDHA